jgi:hypothetical protein
MTIGGAAYAYQQKYEFRVEQDRSYEAEHRKFGEGYGVGLGLGVGVTMVPEDEHRLKKLRDTLDKESLEEVVAVSE